MPLLFSVKSTFSPSTVTSTALEASEMKRSLVVTSKDFSAGPVTVSATDAELESPSYISM